MLGRVKHLEEAHRVQRTPFELMFDSLDAWEAAVRAGVAAGKLDARDMVGADGSGGVVRAIRGWHEQGLFGLWVRDRVWEIGR
jgi:hypothetical protein